MQILFRRCRRRQHRGLFGPSNFGGVLCMVAFGLLASCVVEGSFAVVPSEMTGEPKVRRNTPAKTLSNKVSK